MRKMPVAHYQMPNMFLIYVRFKVNRRLMCFPRCISMDSLCSQISQDCYTSRDLNWHWIFWEFSKYYFLNISYLLVTCSHIYPNFLFLKKKILSPGSGFAYFYLEEKQLRYFHLHSVYFYNRSIQGIVI